MPCELGTFLLSGSPEFSLLIALYLAPMLCLVLSHSADWRLLNRRALCSALGSSSSTTLPPQHCPLAEDAFITLDLQLCSTEGTCLTQTACPFSTLGLVVVSLPSVPLISLSLSNAHFPKKQRKRERKKERNHCFMHLSCL